MDLRELYRRWGTRVRERRTELGLTQSQVAARAGVSQGDVSSIENGLYGFRDDYKAAVADALELPVYKLFPFPEPATDEPEGATP